MTLVPFDLSDAELLVDWVPDAEALFRWCGDYIPWPLTVEGIARHLREVEMIRFFLEENGVKVGYMAIRKMSGTESRIQTVLVSENAGRGRGYGKAMLRLAMEEAVLRFASTEFSLAVFEDNHRARNCYAALGFEVVARDPDGMRFEGKPWPLLEMRLVPEQEEDTP